MNVYNIVWADDQIDELLDDDMLCDLKDRGFNIIAKAHNGIELESSLINLDKVDAVIIDANFNESDKKIESERDTSGLDYARSLYKHKCNKSIPFFLFTGRSDELLQDIYKHNPEFLKDFPRHKRWFNKSLSDEFDDMLNEIKNAVDELNSTNFKIRNKYKDELAAASIIDIAYNFIFEFLRREDDNTLSELKEPFVTVRRIIEIIFSNCEKLKLIPPISTNTNGTAAYFLHCNYSIKNESSQYTIVYEMLTKEIMPRALACSLNYIVDITQDASHSKKDLKWKVNEYFDNSKDTLLLRSVVYILIDFMKWFVVTALNNKDVNLNETTLWKKVDNE